LDSDRTCTLTALSTRYHLVDDQRGHGEHQEAGNY
jgi:hypothetical protein